MDKAADAIPNDAALLLLSNFSVRYARKINVSYQSWEFSHGHTVDFNPEHTAAERRALIKKVGEFVRIQVLQDIVATLPEIEATVGDQPMVVETLKRSLGLIA